MHKLHRILLTLKNKSKPKFSSKGKMKNHKQDLKGKTYFFQFGTKTFFPIFVCFVCPGPPLQAGSGISRLREF